MPRKPVAVCVQHRGRNILPLTHYPWNKGTVNDVYTAVAQRIGQPHTLTMLQVSSFAILTKLAVKPDVLPMALHTFASYPHETGPCVMVQVRLEDEATETFFDQAEDSALK